MKRNMEMNVISLCFFLLGAVSQIFASSDAADWDYKESYEHLDPEHWKEHYPDCGGQRQSPVDLVDSALKRDNTLAPIEFINYDKVLDTLVMKNDGHTLKIEVPKHVGAGIRSASLPAQYRLTQFHFHWPSEHTANGEEFPLEVHLVHANEALSDEELMKNSTGLVVVAMLFKVAEEDVGSSSLQTLVNHVNDAYVAGENVTLQEGVKLSDFLPKDTNGYVRYSGSLTTPGCSEVVEFIIMSNALLATEQELYQFGGLVHLVHTTEDEEDWEYIEKNRRPRQELNGRTLRLHGDTGDLPLKVQ